MNDSSKPKKKVSTKAKIALIVVIILLIIPFPIQYKDGGTVVWFAVLYKVVIWHGFNPDYNHQNPAETADEPEYRTGTSFYIFPFNFILEPQYHRDVI